MMTDLASIQALAPARANIAALMAEYEAEHGAVQTLPIYIGDRPQSAFVIRIPGKPIAIQRTPRKSPAERKPRKNTLVKRQRLAYLRTLEAKGYDSQRMAEDTGYPRKYIVRMLWEDDLKNTAQPDEAAAKAKIEAMIQALDASAKE